MTSGKSDLVDLDLPLLNETEKAYMVEGPVREAVWLPKSLVEYDGHGTFTMPEWLATEKGLI